LIGAFAAVAILLAAIGIFGAMAYAIEQRTREFGVRLALGADRVGILALALGQSARLGLAGTALGLGLSLTLARLLGDALYLVQGKHDGLIYGVSTTDPLTLTCACAGLIGVAALAGLIPARRATRVDPIVALRCE
jgi:putative ABC transport system permease protein